MATEWLVEGPLAGPMGRDYWLRRPATIEPGRTYWPVIGVHGYGGKGSDGLSLTELPDRDGYIGICPSFPNEGYQVLGGGSDEQLINLVADLRRRFRLQERMFVIGFSGGAQFAHRFAMNRPDQVVGCSAHSGGTWGPDVLPKALGIPFAISCGLNDTEVSRGASANRITEASTWFAALAAKGGWCNARLWPGVGHSYEAGAKAQTVACYDLAIAGLHAHEQQALDQAAANVREALLSGDLGKARTQLSALQRLTLPKPILRPDARARTPVKDLPARQTALTSAGLGGRDAENKEHWIDDQRETMAGWSDGPIPIQLRQTRFLERRNLLVAALRKQLREQEKTR